MSFCETMAFQAFWSQSWSLPLRAAWRKRADAPVVPRLPAGLAPGWLRPLWLQRRVAQAVQARLAWRRDHPDAPPYWYEDQSRPVWDETAWKPYPRGWLHRSRDRVLNERFWLDLERLTRLVEASDDAPDSATWTHAALGCCERLAQNYRETVRFSGRWLTRGWIRGMLTSYASQATQPDLSDFDDDDEDEPAEGQTASEPGETCLSLHEARMALQAAWEGVLLDSPFSVFKSSTSHSTG